MKKIVSILLILSFSFAYSQFENGVSTGNLNLNGATLSVKSTLNKEILGSPYLFDNWNTLATIQSSNGTSYSIKNLNFDTRIDRFVSEVAVDSVFVFTPIAVKQVKINNKTFKNLFIHDTYAYYEVIAFGKGKELLRKSYKILEEGVKDPFTHAKKPDKYMLKTIYFINSVDGLQEVKLKKKHFLKIFGINSKLIKKFISQNKLSLKKDLDLKKIFDYYKKI